MDVFGIVSVSGWFISISIVTVVLYLYSKLKLGVWKNLRVPGPKPVLFMGNMAEYFKRGFCYTDLAYVRKYGDVVGTYQCHQPNLLVADPKMIKEIFVKQFSSFTNRQIFTNPSDRMSSAVFLAKDAHWKFLRSTMSPTFTSGKLKLIGVPTQIFWKYQQTMMEKIHKCCKSLVENIKLQTNVREVIDIKEFCGSYTMDVICSTAFGIEVNSQRDPNNQFVYYGKRAAIGDLPRTKTILIMMFRFLQKFIKADIFKKDVYDFFSSALETAAKPRQEGRRDYKDFLQLMLNARHGDSKDGTSHGDLNEYKTRGLNQSEIEANSVIFFIAGYETTANTLSFASYCLAMYPDIQQRVLDEIDAVLNGAEPQYDSISKLPYLDRFLSEVLRLYGAASRFSREASQDTTVNGVFIPKGSGITVPIFALHRNAKYWPDPEKFDPDRFTDENKAKRPEYSYLPFGVGPRVCIGQRLALLEAKMALVYMLQNFTFLTSDRTEIPITFGKGGILRAKNPIILTVTRRQQKNQC